jgi:hypothetical protein
MIEIVFLICFYVMCLFNGAQAYLLTVPLSRLQKSGSRFSESNVILKNQVSLGLGEQFAKLIFSPPLNTTFIEPEDIDDPFQFEVNNNVQDLLESIKERKVDLIQDQRRKLVKETSPAYIMPAVLFTLRKWKDHDAIQLMNSVVDLQFKTNNLSEKIVLDQLIERFVSIENTTSPLFVSFFSGMVSMGYRWDSLREDYQKEFLKFFERSIPRIIDGPNYLRLMDSLSKFNMPWSVMDKYLQFHILLKLYGLKDGHLNERELISVMQIMQKMGIRVKKERLKISLTYLDITKKVLKYVLDTSQENRDELVSFLFLL